MGSAQLLDLLADLLQPVQGGFVDLGAEGGDRHGSRLEQAHLAALVDCELHLHAVAEERLDLFQGGEG